METNINTKKMVSIILPTYNGAKRIKTAINSILDQTYGSWELLIIDDGSKDQTEKIVAGFLEEDTRIRYIKNNNNLGIQKTLNRGLHEARGEYIARIDDDDVWIDVDKLKKQVEFLEQNREHVLLGTGVVVVDENGREAFRYLVPETDKEIRDKILSKNCFVHSSVMFRKDSVVSLGGYGEEEDIRHLEDYDLWMKLGVLGKLANLQIYAVRLTLREEGISHKNRILQAKRTFEIIKKFKGKYPNYLKAWARSVARLIVYQFIKKPLRSYISYK